MGISRSGVPDGIHIDDGDGIWTCEFEEVVVTNAQGKALGWIQRRLLRERGKQLHNFALAGDTLVLIDIQWLWTLKLAQRLAQPLQV